MRVNRTLTIGIIGCLLAGAIVGASQASIEGEVDDSPMTVASGRVGDRVTYAYFARPNDLPAEPVVVSDTSGDVAAGLLAQDQSASASVSARDETGFTHATTFEVQAIDVRADRTGERHDVVIVSSNYREPGDEPQVADHTQRAFIDLGTRYEIGQGFAVEFREGFQFRVLHQAFDITVASVP
ncbi:MAG: hypothetical protein ACRDH5_16650, partial [bacterium]